MCSRGVVGYFRCLASRYNEADDRVPLPMTVIPPPRPAVQGSRQLNEEYHELGAYFGLRSRNCLFPVLKEIDC